MPCTMIGLLRGDAWLTKSGSLLQRRSETCVLTLEGVAVGMGWCKPAMTCNLEGTDVLGIFIEAGGRITKELFSLLLRA